MKKSDQHNIPLNQGSNIRVTMLWTLVGLKENMKSRKGFRIVITCPYILAPNCITFMCTSIFSMASIYACNSNISLDSFTYNLIAKGKASNNNQYPWYWLITHVVTTWEKTSQIVLAIAQVCGKGIFLTKAFIWRSYYTIIASL